MKLPVKFSVPSQTRLRLSGDSVGGDEALWEVQEETWRAFWKPRGKETLRSASKAAVDGGLFNILYALLLVLIINHHIETFWVDVTLRNPMDVDVNLSNLTVVLRDKLAEDEDLGPDVVEVEVVDDLVLNAKEIRTVISTPVTSNHSQLSDILAVDSVVPSSKETYDTPHNSRLLRLPFPSTDHRTLGVSRPSTSGYAVATPEQDVRPRCNDPDGDRGRKSAATC